MTEPAAEDRAVHTKNCQTGECPNDYAVIIVNVDDGTTDFLCMGCNLALWIKVAQEMSEAGMLTPGGDQAAPAPA
jgi:hypothetical protein